MVNYIKDCLHKTNYLVIPGFGGFISTYHGAKLEEASQKIIPPKKDIAFNDKLLANDMFFTNHVAEEEDCTVSQAEILIKEFVSSIQNELETFGVIKWEGVGNFYVHENDGISFEKDDKTNYLDYSFGLPELRIKPIDNNFFQNKTDLDMSSSRDPRRPVRRPVQRKPAPKPISKSSVKSSGEDGDSDDQKKSGAKMAVILPAILVLLLGGLYGIMYSTEKISHGSLNPMKWGASHEVSDESLAKLDAGQEAMEVVPDSTFEVGEEEEIDNPPVVETSMESEISSGGEITTEMNRYFIVIGAFSVEENATSLRDKLEERGLDAKIIRPSNKSPLHKVSIADYENIGEAISKMREMRSDFGNELWVMSY